MFLDEILDKFYLGNSVFQYITCLGVIVLGFVLVFISKKFIVEKQRRVPAVFEKLTGKLFENKIQKYISPFLYVILIYASIKNILNLTEKLNRIVYIIFLILVTFYGIRIISVILKTSLASYLKKQDKDSQEVEQRLKGISTFNNIIIWTLGIIFIISNTGFNITGIVTGLGIGGIALALASQNIFMDLFNYFVIFFDQPFQIGDFIVLDGLSGTVEKIGIKTTRIRSLGGEEIIISNTDLTSKRIHNYKKMKKRRVLFSLGVVYKTDHDQLVSIPEHIKNIINSIEDAEFDRAHFKEFGDSSLVYEIVYFILSSDYNVYMDIQQKINLNIYNKFKELNIDFAYPTRTVYVENHGKNIII